MATTATPKEPTPAEGREREDVGNGGATTPTWWSLLRRVGESLLFPCLSVICPSFSSSAAYVSSPYVTGTILCSNRRPKPANCPSSNKVRICFQEGGSSGPPVLLLDLPVGVSELTGKGGPCRIVLECERAQAGGGPLLEVDMWTVYCNGRKVGFGHRREIGEADVWALEVVRPVSAGAGILPPRLAAAAEDGGASGEMGVTYVRARFERVVGSVDSESYHLVDPAGWLGQELSLFFLRV